MSKITRIQIIEAGLDLLDYEGLDAFSTRKLAQRLGVESSALYWHFKDKTALLQALASQIVLRHHVCPPLEDGSTLPIDWLLWYADNARSFRHALLRYRDGARLHAGSTPRPEEGQQIAAKITYLMRAGLSEHTAGMALYAAGQFTLGCVLEEQARPTESMATGADHPLSAEAAFEFGLRLLVQGLSTEARKDRG
ncbi:TetR/AcrR family transcriptional regulator C-terminal domain-containing protein [Deinococcus sp.]|uniref:TetR/AcrR family transcriptional regulator C-terminal domain-containing protein n=1 Tax=Deinococcus sp. TaxID=47478 RepID=UPI003C7E0B87